MLRPTQSSLCDKETAKHWTENIKRMLEDKEVADTPVCIHKVRHAIRDIKPEAYTPQYIGLGPYHRWRGELFEMEAYKLLASKGAQNHDKAYEKLTKLAESLEKEHIARIRASYDRHLEENEHSLAWMMVIDGIFLLQFLQEHLHPSKSCLSRPRTAHLTDRTQSAYHSILQDIMMFENQIPIFVLERLVSSCDDIICDDIIVADHNPLPSMLLTTCKKLCPLKCYSERYLRRSEIKKYAHLLELLYYLIVPETDNNSNSPSSGDQYIHINDRSTEPPEIKTQHRRQRNRFLNFNPPPFKFEMLANIKFIVPRAVIDSKPVKVFCKITATVIPLIPTSMKRGQGQGGGSSGASNEMNNNGGGSGTSDFNDREDAPKVDEIEIPSVTSLLKAGIGICPTKNDPITSIHFNKMTQTLYLPVVRINANTEVIIRNLVAYEAEAISGPSVLARYTELMNGIIDTANDVKLLRNRGIIVSYLKNDEDVAHLWNGMSRSIRLSHVPSMDTAIKDVNDYFNRKGRVKFIRFTKGCMFCGWRILMLLLALVLMVLMAIQSFCEVYRCPRALGPVAASPPPGPS